MTNRLTALLTERFGDRSPVLIDGGMGTLLQDRGLDDGGAGELWNVDRPDEIRSCHEAYAVAGARILTTNTFGGTRPRLRMHGLEDRVHELNRAAAALAREVADPHGVLVAGDLGPTGELMEPLGTLSAADTQAIFEEQLRGLADGGIDLVLIETMSDLAEVRAAVAAARSVVPDLPVVATLSFDTNLRTMMGVRPGDAVTELAAEGVDAVGANCGRGPGEMATIAAQLVEARPEGLLLVAQSNAGLPQVVGDHFEYDATPAAMAEHARELQKTGIDLIGGVLRLDARAPRRDERRGRLARDRELQHLAAAEADPLVVRDGLVGGPHDERVERLAARPGSHGVEQPVADAGAAPVGHHVEVRDVADRGGTRLRRGRLVDHAHEHVTAQPEAVLGHEHLPVAGHRVLEPGGVPVDPRLAGLRVEPTVLGLHVPAHPRQPSRIRGDRVAHHHRVRPCVCPRVRHGGDPSGPGRQCSSTLARTASAPSNPAPAALDQRLPAGHAGTVRTQVADQHQEDHGEVQRDEGRRPRWSPKRKAQTT